jgi:putative hydrolase of HD superfamily
MNPTDNAPLFPLRPPANSTLTRRLRFLLEADKLRGVERQTFLSDGSRHENSAEHSWHLALAIVLFSDAARESNVDLERAVQLALVHDLVEIYAGDTFVYADDAAQQARIERERVAAKRLFGELPGEQGREFEDLWQEYEAKQTPEARFVAAFDRLCPMLLNFATQGRAWRKHEVSIAQVRERVLPDLEAVPELKAWAELMLDEAVELGFLRP